MQSTRRKPRTRGLQFATLLEILFSPISPIFLVSRNFFNYRPLLSSPVARSELEKQRPSFSSSQSCEEKASYRTCSKVTAAILPSLGLLQIFNPRKVINELVDQDTPGERQRIGQTEGTCFRLPFPPEESNVKKKRKIFARYNLQFHAERNLYLHLALD